jgi:hypothetical protein
MAIHFPSNFNQAGPGQHFKFLTDPFSSFLFCFYGRSGRARCSLHAHQIRSSAAGLQIQASQAERILAAPPRPHEAPLLPVATVSDSGNTGHQPPHVLAAPPGLHEAPLLPVVNSGTRSDSGEDAKKKKDNKQSIIERLPKPATSFLETGFRPAILI